MVYIRRDSFARECVAVKRREGKMDNMLGRMRELEKLWI